MIEEWSGVLQPAVSLKGKGQGVTIKEVSSLPSMARAQQPGEGVEGDWQGRFSASIKKKGPASWAVSFKVRV